jgi:formylmethanofuran dehydrogenase subunit E
VGGKVTASKSSVKLDTNTLDGTNLSLRDFGKALTTWLDTVTAAVVTISTNRIAKRNPAAIEEFFFIS